MIRSTGVVGLPACQLPTGSSPCTSLSANSSIMLRSFSSIVSILSPWMPAMQACTLCRETPTAAATSVAVRPSLITANAGEAIRGLADLEAKERERCANFASKAVAAGLAESTVRIAERQGQLMVEMVQAVL
jgi:hypothetical protein